MDAITDLGTQQLQLKLRVLDLREELADVERQISAHVIASDTREHLIDLRCRRKALKEEIGRLRGERAAIRRQISDEFFGRSGQVVDKQQHSDHHE